jgi:hypothetical protein
MSQIWGTYRCRRAIPTSTNAHMGQLYPVPCRPQPAESGERDHLGLHMPGSRRRGSSGFIRLKRAPGPCGDGKKWTCWSALVDWLSRLSHARWRSAAAASCCCTDPPIRLKVNGLLRSVPRRRTARRSTPRTAISVAGRPAERLCSEGPLASGNDHLAPSVLITNGLLRRRWIPDEDHGMKRSEIRQRKSLCPQQEWRASNKRRRKWQKTNQRSSRRIAILANEVQDCYQLVLVSSLSR